MSKKHGVRKRRLKKARRYARSNPAQLLADVARALNACENAGVSVRFRHGAAWNQHGVILPPVHGGPWEVRTYVLSPGTVSSDGLDEDLPWFTFSNQNLPPSTGSVSSKPLS